MTDSGISSAAARACRGRAGPRACIGQSAAVLEEEELVQGPLEDGQVQGLVEDEQDHGPAEEEQLHGPV